MPKTKQTDLNTTVADLKETVRKFSLSHNWHNKDPRQLLLSTQIELAELMEYFQWTKSNDWTPVKKKKTEIAYEFVDIFYYLFDFLNKTDIDFVSAFYEKLKKINKKYPPGEFDVNFYDKQKLHYRKTGKNKTYD